MEDPIIPAEEAVLRHPMYGLVDTKVLIESINYARTLPDPDEDLAYTGENGDGQVERIPKDIAG